MISYYSFAQIKSLHWKGVKLSTAHSHALCGGSYFVEWIVGGDQEDSHTSIIVQNV